MSALLRVVLAVLATYRLTQLIVNEDGPGEVIYRVREAIGQRTGALWRFINDLVNCEYCVSVWIAAVMAVFVLAPGWFSTFVLVWLGVAGAFYGMQTVKDRMERL